MINSQTAKEYKMKRNSMNYTKLMKEIDIQSNSTIVLTGSA